jgi:hypothetical protein
MPWDQPLFRTMANRPAVMICQFSHETHNIFIFKIKRQTIKSYDRHSFKNEGLAVAFWLILLIWWLKECGKRSAPQSAD